MAQHATNDEALVITTRRRDAVELYYIQRLEEDLAQNGESITGERPIPGEWQLATHNRSTSLGRCMLHEQSGLEDL